MSSRRSLVGACAAVLSLVLTLVGCGGDDSKDSADKSADSAPQSTTKAQIPQPPALQNQEGAKRDLKDFTCEANKDGEWSASGTVTNSAQQPLTYVVSFSVSLKEGGTVRGRGIETLDLEPGESKSIDLKKFFTTTEDGLQCVVTVNRGTKA